MTPDSVSSRIVISLLIMKAFVRASSNCPILNVKPVDRKYVNTRLPEAPRPVSALCSIASDIATRANVRDNLPRQLHHAPDIQSGFERKVFNSKILNGRLTIIKHVPQSPSYETYQSSLKALKLLPLYGKLPQMAHAPRKHDYWPKNNYHSMNVAKMVNSSTEKPTTTGEETSARVMSTRRSENSNKSSDTNDPFHKFLKSLDVFERKFYGLTFTKLSSNSPAERRENGISFIQSGLFLHLLLMTLCTEVDAKTRAQIEQCLGIAFSDEEIIEIVKRVVSTLPVSADALEFRWSSRVVVGAPGGGGGRGLRAGAAAALNLHIHHLNGTETPEMLAKLLNHMVEIDSGGAMHDTFEEDEVSNGTRAALLSTVYVRGRWRSAPTLLNGTRPFRDGAPGQRATRMIRINDVMRYADLTELDAQALEISYKTRGLSLVVVVPRGGSLRALAARAAAVGVHALTARMRAARVAATMPLYTLRMTLLLPTKLRAMGMSRLVDPSSGPPDAGGAAGGRLRLSHAVQRLMFWSEAGRNAFKDDGIEWDEPPELELLVDRPYVFFVRWRNITLMNGNFVL